MSLLAGCLAFTSLVMVNYAIATGLAGVAISVFNTNPTIQVILSLVFLGQLVTPGQITGMVLALVGAVILSLGEMLLQKLCASGGGKKATARDDN